MLRYQAFLPSAVWHADVIVADYPGDLPAYTTELARPVRREIRERLLPAYERERRPGVMGCNSAVTWRGYHEPRGCDY